MDNQEYAEFLEQARISAKNRADDALQGLAWTKKQAFYWQERVYVAEEHYESCKAHYENTLTWGIKQAPTPAGEAQ